AYSVAHHPRPTRRRGIRPRGLGWVRGQEGVPEARAHLQWHTVFTDEHPRGIRRAHRCDPRMLSGSDNTPTRKPSRRRFGVDRGGGRRYYCPVASGTPLLFRRLLILAVLLGAAAWTPSAFAADGVVSVSRPLAGVGTVRLPLSVTNVAVHWRG